jgi:hypothetical protein
MTFADKSASEGDPRSRPFRYPGGSRRITSLLHARTSVALAAVGLAQPSEPAQHATGAPIWPVGGLSVLGRFNSLIVDLVTLFAGCISLFGRVGNLPSEVLNINDLPTQIRSPDGPESGFSQYLSVDQRTRSRPTYSAIRPFTR